MDPNSPSLLNRARPPTSSVTTGVTAGHLNSTESYAETDEADQLGEQLEAVNTSIDAHYVADIVLKLSNMCGDLHIDPEVSGNFTMMVCRMVSRLAMEEDDIALFRRFVIDVTEVANRALRGEKDASGHHFMTMALVDLLRTSSGSSDSKDTEYHKSARSEHRKEECDILQCIRGVRVDKYPSEAYTTADVFDRKLHKGLALLGILGGNASDAELESMLTEACVPLAHSLYALSFATLFDGQRLRAGAWICQKWILSSNFKYANDVNNHLSGALSNVSMQRIKSAFSIFCGLSRFRIKTDPAFACCRDSPEWQKLDELCNDVINWMNTPGLNVCSNPSTSIACFMGHIADWFQKSIGDDHTLFQIIYDAFTSEALVLDSRCAGKDLIDLFSEYMNHHGCRAVSIVQAAEFLCDVRLKRNGGSMNFITAIMVVLSGVVGSWFCKSMHGPFVLCMNAQHCASDIFYKMPNIHFSVSASKSDVSKGATSTGNRCSSTKITNNMMDTGEVRGEHEKTKLVETRLRASLTVLSIKESLARDLPHDVTAATTEGVKNLRSVYITALRVLPGIKALESDKDSSSLIERTEGKVSASANGSNVEKPWRDICGGIIATSILRPQSAMSLKNTIESRLLQKGTLYTFVSTTNNCVEQFSEQLIEDSVMLFRDDILSLNVNDVQYDRSIRVFAQQRAFVSAYCNALKDCGLVWEQLQNSFAQSISRKRLRQNDLN